MDFRYQPYDGAPPPPPSAQRFSYAPYPPPPSYHGKYPLPPIHAPPPSDHGYFYSRPCRASMLPWVEESATGHYSFPLYRPPKDPFLEREYERERTREEVLREVLRRGRYSFLPSRPPKDPFLDREYERERIREEVLREEVRRRIIEEEVRWELAMERYYNLRHSNPGYHGKWTNVQFEQPRFSHGCHTRGPRGQVPSKRSRAKRRVREVQHKIMEINEEELMSKTLVSGNKIKPSNKAEIQKKKDEQMVQTEANGKKVELNVSEIPHKITEVYYEEIRWPQALLKDKVQSPKNQEELRPKASLPEEDLTKDEIKPTPNTKGIEQKGDGQVANPDSGNKVKQSAVSKAPLPEETSPKDKMKPLPNRNNIEKKRDGNTVLNPYSRNKVKQPVSSKAPVPEESLPKDRMKPLPNRNNIEKEGYGNTVLKPDSGYKAEQPASSKAPLPEEALPKDKMMLLPNRSDIQKKGNGNKILKPDSGNKGKQPASSTPLPEEALPKDKTKPLSNRNGVEKEGDGNTVLKPVTGNKIEQLALSQSSKTHLLLQMPTLPALGSHPPLSWPAHRKGQQDLLQVAETCGSKRKSFSALPTTAATSSSSYKVGPNKVKKQKVNIKEYSCTSCQITVNNDHQWRNHLNGKRHQNMLKKIANVEMSKKELKVGRNCGSKRKSDSISALPTPAATSRSSNKVGRRKVKKQKVLKKEHSCTFCQLTVNNRKTWLLHLNGKRHRNMLQKITNVDMSKKVSSDTDNKSTSGIALPAVKVEMDNGDNLATKPTEESQTEEGIIKKMQVGCEVHEVVKRNNRLWCERCQYNCTTEVMMTIHLISKKHKGNCQKQ